jgi:N-acetylmuramoyl-L-alanine amidase
MKIDTEPIVKSAWIIFPTSVTIIVICYFAIKYRNSDEYGVFDKIDELLKNILSKLRPKNEMDITDYAEFSIKDGVLHNPLIQNIVGDLPKHKTVKSATRTIKDIKRIIVHHSADDNGTPESFAAYHVSKGWSGIGYHFVIAKDGAIYQTRLLTVSSPHCKGHNSSAIGVCLVGNFDHYAPTDAQWEAAVWLFSQFKNTLKLEVKGHRELTSTACPGTHFDLNKFRNEI